LRHATSIKEQILARPTFFEHYDGVCVDWRYLRDREKAALQAESGWLKRQGVHVVVDLSSGINLYPTLRLLDNLPDAYASSMAAIQDVMAKMQILPSQDLILSLHRYPENNFTEAQSRTAFTATLKTLAGWAAARGLTLHLRLAFGKPPGTVGEGLDWLDRVGAANLKLAVSTALLAHSPPAAQGRLTATLGLWLVAGSRSDVAGNLWDTHAPIHSALKKDALAQALALCPNAPLVLDAVYASQDEEYLDAVELEGCRTGNGIARR
jgi:hypothetical protein